MSEAQRKSFHFQMYGDVHDAEALLAAALRSAMDDMTEYEAYDMLCNKGGKPSLNACIMQLFDPGVSPDGLSIEGSECAITPWTDEDEEGEDDDDA